MKKLLIALALGLGLPFFTLATNLPTQVKTGDMLQGGTNNNLIRTATSTKGSLWTMGSTGFAGWFNAGSDGMCVKASSTAPYGLAYDSCATGGTGLSNLNGMTGSTQTFATSTTATGLTQTITSATNVHTWTLSLTSGYNIPLTASTTNWNTAYGWGNHATAGYLTASALVPYLTTTTAASTYQPIGSYLTGTKVDSFNTRTGVVTLSSADVTGALAFTPYNATNPSNYIALTALSGTAPINYNNGTGVISLTGIVPIANGGTGTSTAPSLNQLLIGNASGGWNLVATSSLGITGGAYNVISANGLITVSTTTALATLTASTSPNFTAVSATNASTTNLTVATNIYLPGVTNCNSSQYLQITSGIFGCGTPAGGGGSLSGGTTGYLAVWASSTALTTGLLLDDGTVSGVNATSSGTTFFVKGSVGDKPFVVASSTGTALITVLPSGYTGIGYNNPQAPLEVKSSVTGAVKLFRMNSSGNNGDSNKLVFANTFIGGSITGNDVSSIANYVVDNTLGTYTANMLFSTTYNGAFDVQKMILTAEGRLGIGTSSPVGMLTVQGTTTTANLPLFVVASSTNLQLFTVGANGRVGIGSSSPSSLFTVDSAGTNATTTIQFDSIGTKGTCLVLKDADGTGNTYCSVNNGVMTCSTGSCQ